MRSWWWKKLPADARPAFRFDDWIEDRPLNVGSAGAGDSRGWRAMSAMELLKRHSGHVPDFPKPGILFYDVTTLLKDPQGFKLAIDSMAEPYLGSGVTLVVGIESRGFILGSDTGERLGTGFVTATR